MAGTIIRAESLSKRYNGTTALDALNLDVPAGSTGLLGENGAGKTTFIKLLLSLLGPSAGRAEVLGHDVATDGLALRRRIGYMPEDECLPPDHSAHDLVVRLGRLSGLPRESAVQRAYDVLHLVGLGEERYRPIEGYSIGMKQRVKLAQAIVHDPDLVLLDEPTGGLDPDGRLEMLDLIAEIRHKMGLSVLISTHLLPDVERVCEHVVIIREGQVVADGALHELLEGVGEGVMVRVVGDGTSFLERLKAESLDAVETGPDSWLVRGDDPYDGILRAAADTGVELRRLERESRSLEDVFLALHQESAP
ncbi:MAG: ABC transporter ATP-binding protein [Candidatus Bipolaricaulia bacterium]